MADSIVKLFPFTHREHCQTGVNVVYSSNIPTHGDIQMKHPLNSLLIRLPQALAVALLGLLLAGCDPSDTRPGFRLSGEVEAFPSDWYFADDFKQIALQVATPYGLPHSITIWCVQVDGTLYIAARSPESKRWPTWVEEDPDVLLKFGDRLFEGRLQRLNDANAINPVSNSYTAKYKLTADLASAEGPGSWFWRVVSR